MKHFLPCIFIAITLTGCFDTSDTLSAIEYSRQGENEMRHYRPIHRTQREWSMAESAKLLNIKAGKDHLRLSVRTNSDRIVVRKAGVIAGNIEKTEDGARYIPVGSETPSSTLYCRTSHVLQLKTDKREIAWNFDDQGNASTNHLQIKTIGKHRFSVSDKNAQNGETCEGVEVESPFTATGTLMFQESDIPVEELAGYAWFVTKIDSDCLR